MTAYYVRSGATGGGTGADWTNAYITLATAITSKAAGDVFYVSEDHAETSATAITLNFPGTAANPNFIYTVNHAGSVPPVAADLVSSVSSSITSSGSDNITINGSAYVWGVQFKVGSSGGQTLTVGLNASSITSIMTFKKCKFWLSGNTSGSVVIFGHAATNIGTSFTLDDTSFKFANAGQSIAPKMGRFIWINTAIPFDATGVMPTTMLVSASDSAATVEIRGVDLSAVGTIVGAFDTASRILISDCKVGTGTLVTTPTDKGRALVDFVRCDNAGTNYKIVRTDYSGTLTVETTIVRTGGASDGTTAISWKVVTTANSLFTQPFECPPIVIWNDVTGSAKNAAIECIWGGGAVPNNDEIWIDLEYLGSSTAPTASFVGDGKANPLAVAAAQTSSAASWGGSTTKFKLDVSFTAQQKGWIYARVKCAKPSSTFYVDPVITVT